VLNRASHLKQFVKLGAREGWTEIELKGKPKQKNPVIKRFLQSDTDATKFQLNGKFTAFSGLCGIG
jgi:hypothetical protein